MTVNRTSQNYFEIASTPESRSYLIEKVVNSTLDHNFNGLNLNLDHTQER